MIESSLTTTVWVAMLLWMGLMGGCAPQEQLTWSPDRTLAIHREPLGDTYLVDSKEKVVAELRKTFGTVAWSADSKTVYFGRADSIYAWHDGTEQRLATVDEQGICYGLALSPDEKWLALTVSVQDQPGQLGWRLFAYSVDSKKSHVVSKHGGFSAGFIGPDVLTYGEYGPDRKGWIMMYVELSDAVEHPKQLGTSQPTTLPS